MIFHLHFLTGNHLLHANDGRRAQTHDGSIAEEGEKAPWQGPQEKLSDLTSGKALEKSRQFCRSLAQVHMGFCFTRIPQFNFSAPIFNMSPSIKIASMIQVLEISTSSSLGPFTFGLRG